MAKIMVVEDDQSLREIYSIRLTAEGYEVVSAGDGEEALAVAVKEKPDLVLSDVMMPKISGFDMLDILRSTPETKNIKVIMMTALSSDDQKKRGEGLGADRYLVKSQVGIEDVIAAVKDVLGDTGTAPAPAADGAQPVAPTPVQAPVAPAPAGPAPVAPAQPGMPAPVQTPVPPMPTAPAPAPVAPAPAAMPEQPAPMPQPVPQPVASVQPEAPAPMPQPAQPQPVPQPVQGNPNAGLNPQQPGMPAQPVAPAQ